MKYFHISNGCYMPDDSSCIAVKTRRELKDVIAYNASDMRKAHGFGGSKKEVAMFAALCWREAHKAHPAFLPHCLPFAYEKGNYAFGIFVSVATRSEYLEYVKGCE